MGCRILWEILMGKTNLHFLRQCYSLIVCCVCTPIVCKYHFIFWLVFIGDPFCSFIVTVNIRPVSVDGLIWPYQRLKHNVRENVYYLVRSSSHPTNCFIDTFSCTNWLGTTWPNHVCGDQGHNVFVHVCVCLYVYELDNTKNVCVCCRWCCGRPHSILCDLIRTLYGCGNCSESINKFLPISSILAGYDDFLKLAFKF